MIFDGLSKKQAFLDYENIGLRNCRICIFPKGLVHDFGQKVRYSFFNFGDLSKTDREKVFADVLDRKEAFQDY